MINIIGFNAPEWLFANYGAIAAGCVPAGIYTTNLPEACKYIGAHSKAKVVVVEGVQQLKKYYEISKELPDLKALVVYGGDELPTDIKSKCSVPCYTYSEFVKLGKDDPSMDALLKERSSSWKPGETCTLIYSTFPMLCRCLPWRFDLIPLCDWQRPVLLVRPKLS
jgi:long-chain-fatty-acid--CoA ligase ACSBG